MNKHQKRQYANTADWVLYTNPREQLNRCFEMSIDMCEQIDWDQEEECGVIWDLLLQEKGLESNYFNQPITTRIKK